MTLYTGVQAVEVLPGWIFNQATGGCEITHVREQGAGDGPEWAVKLDLTAGGASAGTFQWLEQRVPLVHDMLGKVVTVSVDLWGTLALVAPPNTVSIKQIFCTLRPGAGGSSNVFHQVVADAVIIGTRQRYWFTTTLPDGAGTSWGTDPDFRFAIELNDSSSAERDGYLFIARPKIEFGREATGFDPGAQLRATAGAEPARTFGTAAPTAGTWRLGDIVWHSAPAAAGTIGWVCVTAGTPGTWKTFGAIAS